MNNQIYRQNDFEIDFKEVLWSLLSQWKGVLSVALAMAILVTGLKYYKSVHAYNIAVENVRHAEEMASVPVDEQIKGVIDGLSSEDRSAVEYVVQQKEWLEEERDYFNNSILLQTNPTSQRTLLLDYYIASEDSNSILASLVCGYSSYIKSETVINGLKEAISAESDNKYIAELISSSINNNNEKPQIISYDDGDAVLEVRVVLPESTDISAVENVVTSAFNDYSAELSKTAGKHTIKLINTTEAKLFNNDALDKRNNIIANINNIQNIYLKNAETSLSEKQKDAVAAIVSIKTETSFSESGTNNYSEKPVKPGFSKRYAVLGFCLGILIYTGIYLIILLLKGCVNSAKALENYTRRRLLGEVYFDTETKGFEKLLHSRLVDKYRYRGKENVNEQTQKVIDSMESICNHIGTDSVTLLYLTKEKNAKDIVKASKELKIKTIDVSNDFNEKDLLDTDNAIFMVGRDTKYNTISKLMSLCNEYDINMVGSFYSAMK